MLSSMCVRVQVCVHVCEEHVCAYEHVCACVCMCVHMSMSIV